MSYIRGTLVVMDRTVLFIVIAATVGLVLGYALAWVRAAQVRLDLSTRMATAEGRVRELTARVEHADQADDDARTFTHALGPLQAKVDDLHDQVARAERERIQQHSALSQQLRTQAAVGQELMASTSMLAGALRNSSARGLWGEVELQRLVEAAGMVRHVDYVCQQRLPNGSRPDMVVHLPGGGRIAVDAKVPFDAFLRACELQEDPSEEGQRERQRLLTTHARKFRAHIDALAQRNYPQELGDGPDMTVLFVPAEALLSEAVTRDGALLEYALQQQVCPASPVSLLALLRTIAAAWARQEVAQQAEELLECARVLAERLGTFAEHLDRVGTSLENAVTAYNKAVGSYQARLLPQARALERLHAEDAKDLTPLDIAVRRPS